MSYTKKNNSIKQLNLLDRFVRLYGIHGLSDITTEVKSCDLTRFNEMTSYIEEIQEVFKTSGLNLGRTNGEITRTNAIPVLKHLCMQARILIEKTKYSGYCTYALTPENPLLKSYRYSKFIFSTNQPSKVVCEPYGYFDSLKCERVEQPFSNRVNDKHQCMRILGENFRKKGQCNYNLPAAISMVKHKCKVMEYTFIDTVSISTIYEKEGERFLSIRLDRDNYDIIKSLLNLELYDEQGNKIIPAKLMLANTPFEDFLEIESGDDLDIPLFSLPYSDMRLNVYFEDITPIVYKSEFLCRIFTTKITRLCKNFKEYDITDGSIGISQHPVLTSFVTIVSVYGDDIIIPRYTNAITEYHSSTDIKIVANNKKLVFTGENPTIPLPTYLSIQIEGCYGKQFSFTYKYIQISDNTTSVTIDGSNYDITLSGELVQCV